MTKALDTARQLPGLFVGTTLQAARLPLTAVARVAGQTSNEEWPPFVAFDTAEAAVERTLGSLLRDDSLLSRGRLRQARVAKLKDAAQLEAVAEQKRRQADAELAARKQAAEARREQVEETAEQREQRIEQQAAQRQAKVAKAAAGKKAAVRKQTAAATAALDKQERRAKLAAADAEASALDLERAALAAEDAAITADAKIDESKRLRASS